MFVVDPFAQGLDQRGVINCDGVSRWRLNIEHQVVGVGVKRSHSRRQALRLLQINRTGGLVRITEPRLISQHPALLPSGEIGESLWTGRTRESKETVAVNSRVARKHLVQL